MEGKDSRGEKRSERQKKHIDNSEEKNRLNNLSSKDRMYLTRKYYILEEMEQMDYAIPLIVYAVRHKRYDDRCLCITAENARKLLGDKQFLRGVSKSAFDFEAEEKVEGTDYTVIFDANVLRRNSVSKYVRMKELNTNVKEIMEKKNGRKDIVKA